jgi:aspartyl-tRNA(Asn)/glutamyl-tRNA(Gln) amidotransferase subunit A
MASSPGRISGFGLRTLARTIRSTPLRHAIGKVYRKQLGIDPLHAFCREHGGALPQDAFPLRARPNHERETLNLGAPTPRSDLTTSRKLTADYAKGKSPVEVAERCFQHAKKLSESNWNVFLATFEQEAQRAASESAARYRAGTPKGPLDGVIVPVKEEVNVAGTPTRLGANVWSNTPAEHDAVPVARLREAGAVIVGHTVMTEFGLSPLGGNAMRNMPRNAHSRDHLPGGSSTGSAVAVATGLAPVALSADGGGSIRGPAAYNGVFGIKPTYGRVPLTGHGLPAGATVVHLGPIGASTEDLAEFLEVTAGPDAGDGASNVAPARVPGEFTRALGRGVRGLRIGIDEALWEDASDSVTAPCRVALAALERDGATLVKIETETWKTAAAVGYLTIGLEVASALARIREEHLDEVGLDIVLTLCGLNIFRSDDYLVAQRVRSALRLEAQRVLGDVDLIALPSTGTPAPPVSDAEARSGFVDPIALDSVCRFAFLGNLTGLPAASAPVGMGPNGLPVGLQLMGDAWDEACVLQAVAHLERIGAASVVKPASYVDILE